MTGLILKGRRGASAAGMLVFLAALSVAAALLYPAWSVRGFRARVQASIAEVDALGSAARAVRDNTNRWPTPAPIGEVPPELSGLRGADGASGPTGYAIQWTAWEVVDSVEAPAPSDILSADDAPQEPAEPAMLPILRSVGGIIVHSGERALLAELLEHYTEGNPFVVDTMWHLILPERAEPLSSR
jgi:hypothetical protein